MNYMEIETLLMIVETKSITKTGEQLFLSQPTVSHRLKMLEEELNMQLVTRKKGHKSIELTAKGEEFIPIAEKWISLWKETQMLCMGKEKMFLTIGAIDTLSTTVFTPLYHKLIESDPSVSIRIKTHQSYELYGLLEKHEIDVGFVYHNLYCKNIITTPVMVEKMYLVQSPGTQIRKESIHTDELDPSRELFFNWEMNYHIWHEQWINRKNVPRIQVDSYGLVKNMMTNKNLWMIAPETVVLWLAQDIPIYISEIANKVSPPERVTYKIRHKNANPSVRKGIGILDDLMKPYLNREQLDPRRMMESRTEHEINRNH